jgi:hypothetical protein
MAGFPLFPYKPIPRPRNGDTARGVAVQDDHSDLELRDLTVEVPRHGALAQQVLPVHFLICPPETGPFVAGVFRYVLPDLPRVFHPAATGGGC